MKFYTGRAVDARRYVEADSFGADDYYLGEGSGVAARYLIADGTVEQMPAMDSERYERWVAGFEVEGGKAKGRLRTDGVKFVEVTVNGPKTWSLAAAVHPDVSVAYDAAQHRAAVQILAWLGKNATTRVGPQGRQVQVPVEKLEAAVVAHRTSRAGDPHWHLHLQVNARVWAAGNWRGLHTVGVRDSVAAINGIGHAAVMTDPGFRAALAAHGYHLDPSSGEIVELEAYGEAFSARSKQIGHNIDRYETQWRREHPGEEAGPRLRQAWDRRAWTDERPDKVVPASGAALERHWRDELAELGFREPRHKVELVLDLACRYAADGHIDLDDVRRFTDPDYADLSLRMRTGESPGAVFDRLRAGGQIVVHSSEAEQVATLADLAATEEQVAVVADTCEEVARINGLAHQQRSAHAADARGGFVTRAGERIAVGDRVATRRNDVEADVANRETWTVAACRRKGVVLEGVPVVVRCRGITPATRWSSPTPPRSTGSRVRPSRWPTSPSVRRRARSRRTSP